MNLPLAICQTLKIYLSFNPVRTSGDADSFSSVPPVSVPTLVKSVAEKGGDHPALAVKRDGEVSGTEGDRPEDEFTKESNVQQRSNLLLSEAES